MCLLKKILHLESCEVMYTFIISLSHSLSVALVDSESLLLVLNIYLWSTSISFENLLEECILGSQADLQTLKFWAWLWSKAVTYQYFWVAQCTMKLEKFLFFIAVAWKRPGESMRGTLSWLRPHRDARDEAEITTACDLLTWIYSHGSEAQMRQLICSKYQWMMLKPECKST